MFAANAHVIRRATDQDADALRRFSDLAGEEPLRRPVLVGELDGRVAAGVSLFDGRSVADPLRSTGTLVAHLRMRAGGMRALDGAPTLRVRLRAGVTTPANAVLRG